jgi:hypothetical protein
MSHTARQTAKYWFGTVLVVLMVISGNAVADPDPKLKAARPLETLK